MDNELIIEIFIFLTAACIIVPLVSRFKLGSVLGYLAVGILIGPFGIGLIANAHEIMHFAEFGVIMMLFLIGLELEPPTLWKLRKSIIGLGGLQVIFTSGCLSAIGVMLGYDLRISLACGTILALSSTALVLQMMQEKSLMPTSAGKASFAVLLFQDIAVIPILIVMPLLSTDIGTSQHNNIHLLSELPGWLHGLIVVVIILLMVVIGRYLSYYLFRFIARTHIRELSTATSLAIVIGINILMEKVGLSAALGAFVAGVVLANSEYKHSLETDIEPFKGLLLGLFFISVGMEMNFKIFANHPLELLSIILALVTAKAIVLLGLGKLFKMNKSQNIIFAVALAQGGEFAFVLSQYTETLHIISQEIAAILNLIVAVSMAITPLLMILIEKFVLPRFISVKPEQPFDTINENSHPVIIAGYGRFGQIIGRFMKAQGIKLTILEKDPDQIELLRHFGNKVYFGDASNIDFLRSAGAQDAKLLIIAVEDTEQVVEIALLAKQEFPNLKVFARARNRRHAYELHKAGVDYFRRETFDSSIAMAEEAMKTLGYDVAEIHYKAKQFIKHDEITLRTSFEFFEQETDMVNFAKQATEELEQILQSDQGGK